MVILQGLFYLIASVVGIIWLRIYLKSSNPEDDSKNQDSKRQIDSDKLEHMKDMFFKCLRKLSQDYYPEEVAERKTAAQLTRLCHFLSLLPMSDLEALASGVHEHVISEEAHRVPDFGYFCKEFLSWESTQQQSQISVTFVRRIVSMCECEFFASRYFDPESLTSEKRSLANVRLICELFAFRIFGAALANMMINRLFTSEKKGIAGMGGSEALRELYTAVGVELDEDSRRSILDSDVME